MPNETSDTIDLPGLTLSRNSWEQIEKRRILQESILGRPVKFREVLEKLVEDAVSRQVMA